MKRITLLFSVIIGMCLSLQAFSMTVQISGYVTDIANGAAIANHYVYIVSDTINGNSYYGTAQTNANGWYSADISNVNPNDSVMFTVYTYDCANVIQSQVVAGNATPVTVNFQICTGTPPALTVSITGHVYEAGTVIPVPNQTVYIAADSSGGFNFFTTVITDAAGFYGATITNVPQATNFTVTTYDCNYIPQSQTVNGDNTPLTVDFYICVGNPNPTGTVWGHVYAANIFADHARVDLIHSQNDSLIVVASCYVNDSAGVYYFGNVPAGNYILMAELLENSAYYGQFFPTYYNYQIYWNDATLITVGNTTNQYEIALVEVNGYAPGEGNIQGTIQQGSKGSGGVPNMEVLLLDQNNSPLAFTVTDVSGQFTFPNIAYGTYVVFPQMLDVNTTPATVTLTEGDPNANLIFFLDNGNVYTGIGVPENPANLVIFPNPVREYGSFIYTPAKETQVHVMIYDLTGKLVDQWNEKVQKGGTCINFSSASLRNGVYSMKITGQDGISITRKFVVNK